ncbi:Gfo/Idh/MocA family protein [Ilumatobacter nonamiensis]|uniref:Gfo/Idh/MocA family protein n=1 Tax=Ilumatobacter nonamiensis TaxID=467093 RepID=UPI00058E4541|nr:Gfo/Idh/MocA family oxidoreductase [Ilumatobacter nonamiensis]
MSTARPVSFAVVGADHLHLFELVDRLVAAGAIASAHAPLGDLTQLYADWRAESIETSVEAILDDPDVDLVVLAGVPKDRAELAIAALRRGKRVLSAKPGVTTPAQLGAIREELAGRAGRPWTVLFTERFENRAIGAAIDLARSGALGEIVHVIGGGPHRLGAEGRPEWFWDHEATGGILVDIGSHQADQLLAIAFDGGASAVVGEVRTSSVGNVACGEHPGMQDIGSMTLVANGVVGDHRVDFLTPDGLDSWGDVRLQIVGTRGTAEARANVDPAGEAGAEHLIVVDREGTRRVDVSEHDVDWAPRFLADLRDDGERLMSQAHVLEVCDLTLRAQEAAVPWGT